MISLIFFKQNFNKLVQSVVDVVIVTSLVETTKINMNAFKKLLGITLIVLLVQHCAFAQDEGTAENQQGTDEGASGGQAENGDVVEVGGDCTPGVHYCIYNLPCCDGTCHHSHKTCPTGSIAINNEPVVINQDNNEISK
ncbi:uncharacterized protein [Antedon mediterranea]|uniref:uncharacterized protein n=1 Tax=Antedon mediterranea TaxID=105859 RepID=UPI003AF88284